MSPPDSPRLVTSAAQQATVRGQAFFCESRSHRFRLRRRDDDAVPPDHSRRQRLRPPDRAEKKGSHLRFSVLGSTSSLKLYEVKDLALLGDPDVVADPPGLVTSPFRVVEWGHTFDFPYRRSTDRRVRVRHAHPGVSIRSGSCGSIRVMC